MILSKFGIRTQGLLWAHVTSDTVPTGGTLTQPPDPDYPVSHRTRSSVYVDGTAEPYRKFLERPTFPIEIDPFLLDDCLVCGSGNRGAFPIYDPLQARLLVASGQETIDATEVIDGAALRVIGPDVPGTLVVASEPRALVQRQPALRAVKLDDAPRLTGSLAFDGARLSGASTVEPSATDLAAVATAERSAVPPAAIGSTMVLAASYPAIFRVGGLVDGAASPSLWMLATAAGWRQTAVFGPRPAEVLSATYSLGDDCLYVLDEVGAERKRRVRLLRLLPTGNSRLLGEWPRRARSRVWLNTTVRGELVFSFTSSRGNAHAVLVAEVARGRLRPLRFVAGSGRLSVAARLGERWLSRAVETPRGPRIIDLPREELLPASSLAPCDRWW